MSNINNFKSVLSYEGRILTRYKYQQEIQSEFLSIIKSALPEKLSRQALYCVVSGKQILIYTDSANWSSQLRFYAQDILQALLVSNRGTFESLQIKIIPKTGGGGQAKSINIPSAKNINFILNQAENQADEKLKNALFNLGITLKKISDSDC